MPEAPQGVVRLGLTRTPETSPYRCASTWDERLTLRLQQVRVVEQLFLPELTSHNFIPVMS
jgi:hypothetical protein